MIPLEIIKNRLGLTTFPSFCTYIITWRCNAHCKMCSIWKKPARTELSLEEIINIFKQLKLDGIRITGGEPFLREDLAQIVNAIQRYSKPKVVHITSNGILTDRILSFFKALKKTENLHLKISIDAVGEKHDEIRGVKGAYQSALKTVKELLEIKNKLNFYLGINQTIVDENGLKDYWQLKKFCKQLNIPLHLQFAYSKVALYDEKENITLLPKKTGEFDCFFDLTRDKTFEILNILKRELKVLPDCKEKLVEKYYLKGLYNRLVHKKGNPNPPCLALRSHLRILPNGDVPICLFNSSLIGNLSKTPLKELWFSNQVKRSRQTIKQCPGCWAGCEVIPSAIYSGDIIKGLF